ncbi:MAG: hypothetical protein JW871_01600 [Endomicrobiales bacterium]|nr:hypothetical protein [Endomicrobiales bacterium]
MEFYSLIKPLGIITYTLLLITIISGKLQWNMKKHIILASITVILATIHAILVILY